MAQIQPITIPTQGEANNLLLRVLPFDMDATSCSFYYELQNISPDGVPKSLIQGNLNMDETDFANWAADNNYCLIWAANKLGITLI